MRSRARRWSRTAFLVAGIFGAMAVGSRLLTGGWPFDGAPELAVLCTAAGGYFYVVGRRHARLPDGTERLERALALVAEGKLDQALALLSKAIGENPTLWQALQYRAEILLARGDTTAAEADLREALRIAPDEAYLRTLLERVG